MLTFDLETLPSDNPEVIKRIAATIKPPINYTKEETIEKWKKTALDEAINKTSFDALYGRIACIAWQIGHDVYNTGKEMSEREVINSFYHDVDGGYFDSFCGHNIASFDLPFLMRRSMILGIKPPAQIMKAMLAKPWDDCIKDTMIMWTGSTNKYISLDTLLWHFGIDHGHPDFDGSMVAETWETDPQKVIDYCADDVRATYELYQKMTFNDKVF